MIRNGVRMSVRFVFSMALTGAVVVAPLLTAVGPAGAASNGGSITEEAGLKVAAAALAYADVAYVVDDEERQGVPYAWGGRTPLDAFAAAVAGGDVSMESVSQMGVDASGLVVNVLRDLNPSVRFAASAGNDPVLWADATSAMLYEYNVVPVPPAKLRAGDLVFFGAADSVTGVAVVTGRAGTRVDFVVASAGQGRVVHTFARTDGDYWHDNIVGGGRLTASAGSFDL